MNENDLLLTYYPVMRLGKSIAPSPSTASSRSIAFGHRKPIRIVFDGELYLLDLIYHRSPIELLFADQITAVARTRVIAGQFIEYEGDERDGAAIVPECFIDLMRRVVERMNDKSMMTK